MGAVRIHRELMYQGEPCSENRVARLMKQLNIQRIPQKRQWRKQPIYLHSDRGSQFTSDDYQQFLKDHHVICSMSKVGSCADNAACEGFFGRLKRERVNRRYYRTRAEARTDIFDYIERFHNPRKRREWEIRYN